MDEGFTYQEVTDEMIVDVIPSFDSINSNVHKSLFIFDCHLTLENLLDQSLILKKSHWIIRKGPKVNEYITLSEDLQISPFDQANRATSFKKSFRLDVAHASVRGKLELVDECGDRIWVPIPLCFLRSFQEIYERRPALWT